MRENPLTIDAPLPANRTSVRAMGPAVAVEGLGKSFRNVVALEDVNLAAPPGSMYLLLGPNGSGKTTLILLLAGVLRPTDGSVRVLGEDPYRHPERLARDVGIAYENHHLPSWSNARTYLRFAARAKGLDDHAVDAMGERFGLRMYWDREMGTYSAGMKKRVMLAQAWLGEPRLLVLDEPFSNLDPEGRRLLADLLAARASAGTTTLVATHLAEPGTVPTHIVCLLNGRAEADGPIRALGERYEARTVMLAVPDPVGAVRLLLEEGLRFVSISEDGLAMRGNTATVEAATDALRARGIPARVVSESYDVWAIYRAVLLGGEREEKATMNPRAQ